MFNKFADFILTDLVTAITRKTDGANTVRIIADLGFANTVVANTRLASFLEKEKAVS